MLVGSSDGHLRYYSFGGRCEPKDLCGGEKGICKLTMFSPSISLSSSKCECSDTVGPHCLSCPVGKIEQLYTYAGASLVSALSCKSCTVGFWSDIVGYSANAVCKSCEPGRMFIDTTTDCVDCTPGLYQSESAKAFCVDCRPGMYQNEKRQTNCKECDAGQWQEFGKQTNCVTVESGMYVKDTGKAFRIACGTGTYQPQEGKTSCKGKLKENFHFLFSFFTQN